MSTNIVEKDERLDPDYVSDDADDDDERKGNGADKQNDEGVNDGADDGGTGEDKDDGIIT